MKSVLCCLVLGMIPALGQIAPVAVYTKFEHQPSPGVLPALKEETAAILSRLDVRVVWRSIQHVRAEEVWAEVAVVTFKGACDVAGATPPVSNSRRLGWTHISDGEVLPFAEVDCGLVRSFVARQLLGMGRKEADQRYARALGRVVAHELYHILGRSTHHSSRGVDRPVFTAQELVSDRFLLDESPYRILQSRTVKDPATRTPQSGRDMFRARGCASCHGTGGEGSRNGPALRIVGRFISPVGLAARLGIGSANMLRKAAHLKVPPPSVEESDIVTLVQFLNTGY
jgi:Cytochrome c